MPYITIDVDPNGRVKDMDGDASLLPTAYLAAGIQLITAQLLAMIEVGMPQTQVHNLGGDICALIGKALDQHKETTYEEH